MICKAHPSLPKFLGLSEPLLSIPPPRLLQRLLFLCRGPARWCFRSVSLSPNCFLPSLLHVMLYSRPLFWWYRLLRVSPWTPLRQTSLIHPFHPKEHPVLRLLSNSLQAYRSPLSHLHPRLLSVRPFLCPGTLQEPRFQAASRIPYQIVHWDVVKQNSPNWRTLCSPVGEMPPRSLFQCLMFHERFHYVTSLEKLLPEPVIALQVPPHPFHHQSNQPVLLHIHLVDLFPTL
mmetsp:Transcript_23768/g.37159  ORF Transcript_23768/g.37159 Transcript_23768/m.37159 type:complete len:231 (+) Transcript_23768:436-1128(+)